MSAIICFLQLILAVLVLPLHILQYLGIWDLVVKKLFPLFISKFTVSYNKAMEEQKKSLFSNLSDFAGSSKELRLLDVGCGSGANFKFYPNGCRVTCLDLNPNFQTFLSKSQAENDHLKYDEFLVASADNMTPVADASMDVVVCTLLACSVPSTPAVLKEVQRVLRPMQRWTEDSRIGLMADERGWHRCLWEATLNVVPKESYSMVWEAKKKAMEP
ncbi:methyltransferase-like protein 7A isoform X2 [Rana temporaria]|uniref:methyltransferase-like protein 7A isoform X2 n=1 Tax=Rana temporaria TaxID=8407 RepID=UPI001AADC889|nr:methyltransferase-like protein 7A isoform X2 [Rana temporaria]